MSGGVCVGSAIRPGPANSSIDSIRIGVSGRPSLGKTSIPQRASRRFSSSARGAESVRNTVSPGWRASVHISNDGKWEHHYGAYDTDWIYLDFTDNNSHSSINICINDVNNNWYCGWGKDVKYGTAWSSTPNHTMTGF